MLTLDLVLLLLALVCFVLAAFGVNNPRDQSASTARGINLTAAGLAFWMTSVIL